MDPYEQRSVKFESKYKSFHSRKCIECVSCEMAVILSRGRWVNTWEIGGLPQYQWSGPEKHGQIAHSNPLKHLTYKKRKLDKKNKIELCTWIRNCRLLATAVSAAVSAGIKMARWYLTSAMMNGCCCTCYPTHVLSCIPCLMCMDSVRGTKEYTWGSVCYNRLSHEDAWGGPSQGSVMRSFSVNVISAWTSWWTEIMCRWL